MVFRHLVLKLNFFLVGRILCFNLFRTSLNAVQSEVSRLGVQDTVYGYVQVYIVEYQDFLTKEVEVLYILSVLKEHVGLYILLPGY